MASFTTASACRVGTYTLRTVANLLSWIVSLRDMRRSKWHKLCSLLAMEVFFLSRNRHLRGSFHITRGYSLLSDGALFRKAHLLTAAIAMSSPAISSLAKGAERG